MKLIHLSDLHIGKRINEFSLLEDQEYILEKITDIIDEEKPDAVLIAGDVYDKSVPSAEAVQLFDRFLVNLAKRDAHIFVISGNHDSAERIAFGGRLMDISGVHMSPVYDGKVEPVTLTDEYGTVSFYMLPFVKPQNVRRFFEDADIVSYTDALKTAVDAMNIDQTERNVIITHQFVTGAVRSESEEISVGGSDNVDADVFGVFDYTALGHIHAPQNIGRDTIRYCGTPLKYSFSEVNHIKSVTVVELSDKGKTDIRTVPLVPMRDMRIIKGEFHDIRNDYKSANDDYVQIILTDEDDIPEAMAKLRVIYPNLAKLEYDNKRTRSTVNLDGFDYTQKKSPLDLFCEFFEKQNNNPMSDEQYEFIKRIIEEIREGEE